MVLFLFSTYIRENSLGPSVYTQYVQETLAPLDTSGPLPENHLDPISFKNKPLQQALLKYFEKDGEQLFHKSQFLILLYMLDMLLTDMDILEVQKADVRDFAMLWRARLKFQLDLHLSSSVTNLKDASMGLYKEYIDKVRQASKQDKTLENTLTLLLIEQFYCLLHFYKYEKAEAALKEA